MNLNSVYLVLLFSMIQLLCWSCVYNNVEDIQPESFCKDSLPAVVSFSKDIQPILQKNCSTVGCHSGSSPKKNFNLETSVAYNQLLKPGSGYVDTLNPRYSVVYSSLVSTSSRMPPSGRLDPCSIDMIEKWMLQKAKNN